MDISNFVYVKRHSTRGWFISRNGQKIGTAENLVDAVDFANRLSEREFSLYGRNIRVLFVDDKGEEAAFPPI